MADFVRRFVSGGKARFRDEELDLELDLAYITDRIIVMGYPSKGVEGLYRNRREDAKKFLEHRHGQSYWVFNFCPVKENSYPAAFFDGRVSRYPFPDHHAPPLAVLPLIAREMHAWLDKAPDNVAVLHCKAGKGRSGTMACAYLLTLSDVPKPANIGRSRTAREVAKERAEEIMNTMPADVDSILHADAQVDSNAQVSDDPIKHEMMNTAADGISSKAQSMTMADTLDGQQELKIDRLQHVLDLHTAGRMKRPSTPTDKVKPGVSIPSQRRWLYYWSLLIAHQGPRGFWPTGSTERAPTPKVRLTHITIKMRELPSMKANLLKATNAFIDKTGRGKAPEVTQGSSRVWASLARYDDDLVNTLERWERLTRHEDDHLGRSNFASHQRDEHASSQVFADAGWDKGKMVRPFARLGTIGNDAMFKEEHEQGKRVLIYNLRPLSGGNWDTLKGEIEHEDAVQDSKGTPTENGESSVYEAMGKSDTSEGVALDAHREVRVKLYMGQVYVGWFWFIPSFHMVQDSAAAHGAATLRLTRKELDFPLGVGSYIVDVDVSMEWYTKDAGHFTPPIQQSSSNSQEMEGDRTKPATVI